MSRLSRKKRGVRLAELAVAQSMRARAFKALQAERKDFARLLRYIVDEKAQVEKRLTAVAQELEAEKADKRKIREAVVSLRTCHDPALGGFVLDLRSGSAYGEQVRGYRHVIDERVIEFGRVPPRDIVTDVVEQAMDQLFRAPARRT